MFSIDDRLDALQYVLAHADISDIRTIREHLAGTIDNHTN